MDQFIDYDQASEVTGLPKGTLYSMVSQKQIPHFRLGNRLVRFSESELRAWLQQQYVAPENKKAVGNHG